MDSVNNSQNSNLSYLLWLEQLQTAPTNAVGNSDENTQNNQTSSAT